MELSPGAFLFNSFPTQTSALKPIPLRCSNLTLISFRAGCVSVGCFHCPFGKLRDFYYRAALTHPALKDIYAPSITKRNAVHGLFYTAFNFITSPTNRKQISPSHCAGWVRLTPTTIKRRRQVEQSPPAFKMF